MPARPDPLRQPSPGQNGLDWNDLRLFLAVVAHGSLNAAGRALGQSQGTMARRIRAFEETLGVSLFQRGPNRLDLTEAGRAVLEAAAPMAEAADAVPNVAAAFRPDPEAPVRITATTSVTLFVSRHASDLSAASGGSAIAFIPTRRRLDLQAGEADIALRMMSPGKGEDLIARKVGGLAFAVYARSRDVTALIAPPDDPELAEQAKLVRRASDTAPIAARIGDMPIRYQAAKAGLGAAVLPCWLGDSDAELVRVVEPPAEMIEDVFLVMHRRARSRPTAARVADALVGLFRRERAALLGRGA